MLPIRFINLDRAGERRIFMDGQFRALGLEGERVRAVEAGDVPPLEMARLRASWQRLLSPGEVACFLSHRTQWQRVMEEGRPALVLEDDAVFSPRLPAVLRAAETLDDAELLNLEDVGRKRFLARRTGPLLAEGVHAQRCFRDKAGAGAYVIWPAGARRVLEACGRGAGLADSVLFGAGLTGFVCEPPVSMQLSVLALRGVPTATNGASLLEPERSTALRSGSLRFAARRTRAQIALLPDHLRRLAGGALYRRVEVEEGDFISSAAVQSAS